MSEQVTVTLRGGDFRVIFYPRTETCVYATPFRALHMTFDELERALLKDLQERGARVEEEAST